MNEVQKKKAGKTAGFFLCCMWCICCTACVSSGRFKNLDNHLAAGDFADARKKQESEKNHLYGAADTLLYYLDAGMLSHFAGDYEDSNNALSEAEKLIARYYAKSVSQTIASFVVNDLVSDYAGEDYEDIYSNLFMALNYIQLGKTEDAFVEIRRFDNKIKLLSSKYEQAIHEAQQQTEYAQSQYSRPDLQFHNSAFARYISLLLYRSAGKTDSARIDYKYMRSAFDTQPSLYPFDMPSVADDEFSVPAHTARLNVLCFSGSAPEKREEVIRIPDPTGTSWFKIALPVMYKRSGQTAYAEVEARAQNGSTSTCTLQLLESMENIAEDTFRRKQALIYTKSLLRALSKTAAAVTATAVLEAQDDAGLNALGGLIGFASNIFMEVSERADTRHSRYFPAEVRAGGLNLADGVYRVQVTCYDKNDRILYTQVKENVTVKSNTLTIVEAVCTR